MQREVDLASGERRLLGEEVLFLDVLHLGEALRLQEGFGHVLGSHTNGADIPDQPELRGLRRRLRGDRPRAQAEEPRRAYQGPPTQQLPSAELFSILGPHGNLPSRGWSVRPRERLPVDSSALVRTDAAPNAAPDA